MVRALGAALLGSIAGALVGVVAVDYTDASASHTVVDLVIVGLCTLAGVGLALWIHLRRAGGPVPRRPPRPQADPRRSETSDDRSRPIDPCRPAS